MNSAAAWHFQEGTFWAREIKIKTSLKNFLEKKFSDISGTTRKALKTSFFISGNGNF